MKSFFDTAWQELKQIYFDGKICSERHMQCELFRLLNNNPEFTRQYQIFAEPRITLPELYSKIPDFLITSGTKVIAAVELKYVPHTYSKYDKDFDTLIGFFKLFKDNPEYEFPLKTNPSNGEWADERFSFDKELKLIYCIITKVDAYVITHHKELWKCDDDSKYGKISYLQYVGAIPVDTDENWTCLQNESI